MKRVTLIVMLMVGAVLAADYPKGKYAIMLQAGAETNEGKARAAHALLYACDLAEQGFDVVLIYDGAGTGWAKEFRKQECPMHEQYRKMRALGIVEEICSECAEIFDVKKNLTEQQKKLLVGDYEGHPSMAKWAARSYSIIVL